ncbi:MAG: tyrosine-type recombinase/integrase [Cytophagaceae bacterium]
MKLEDYLQERYTEKTAEAYRREIEAYLQSFPKARTAVYQDITAYLGTLRKRYDNPATVNRILCSIKAYYDFLNYSGKRKDNPARSIYLRDKTSRDIQLQDLFTEKELESLLERKERFTLLTYRNRVLTSLLIYQALLPTELENLTVNEINLDQGTIYIKGTSKTNARELPLKPTQIMLLHQYINEIRHKLLKGSLDQSLLIGSRGEPMKAEDITKHVKRSFRNKFKGRNVNVTTIRQSVITNLLKAGNDLRVVQVFAGHKYPSTTEKYKQTNVEALQMAINQHHPIQ